MRAFVAFLGLLGGSGACGAPRPAATEARGAQMATPLPRPPGAGEPASQGRDNPPAPPTPTGPHLRVLGTAQDGGIPHAACDCGRCVAAREGTQPRRHVASVALVLPDLQEVYLFDATPDIRPQLAMLLEGSAPQGKVNRSPVNGVFLTHAHMGHYLGLAFLGFEAVSSRDLPVYSTPAMAEFLRENAPWDQLIRLGNIAPMPTAPGHGVTLGDVVVTAVNVPHRDEYADTVAYVFQGPKHRAVYVPDADPWSRWEQQADELFEGADILVVDATFYSADELPGRSIEEIGHPLMADSMDRWEQDVKSGSRSVHFTHLNHSNAALNPDGPQAQEVARRGFDILLEGRRIEL